MPSRQRIGNATRRFVCFVSSGGDSCCEPWNLWHSNLVLHTQEVEVLMSILCKYCAQFEEEAKKNNMRVNVLSTDRHRVSFFCMPSTISLLRMDDQ